MYVHQALPKEFNALKNPPYQIKKKSSPKQKLLTPRLSKDLSEQAIKHSSSEKAHLHHIASKHKPHLASHSNSNSPTPNPNLNLNPNPNPNPNHIYSISHSNTQNSQHPRGSRVEAGRTPLRQKERAHEPTKEVVMCRMENKVTKTVECPFYYSDLSQIDAAFCHAYEGQSRNNGIRHGFGIQYYVNGEKFVGVFVDNRANGQGTYYSLRKKIMGLWENDKLKEAYLEL